MGLFARHRARGPGIATRILLPITPGVGEKDRPDQADRQKEGHPQMWWIHPEVEGLQAVTGQGSSKRHNLDLLFIVFSIKIRGGQTCNNLRAKWFDLFFLFLSLKSKKSPGGISVKMCGKVWKSVKKCRNDFAL